MQTRIQHLCRELTAGQPSLSVLAGFLSSWSGQASLTTTASQQLLGSLGYINSLAMDLRAVKEAWPYSRPKGVHHSRGYMLWVTVHLSESKLTQQGGKLVPWRRSESLPWWRSDSLSSYEPQA